MNHRPNQCGSFHLRYTTVDNVEPREFAVVVVVAVTVTVPVSRPTRPSDTV